MSRAHGRKRRSEAAGKPARKEARRTERLGKRHASGAKQVKATPVPDLEFLKLAIELAQIGLASHTHGESFIRSREHDMIYGVEPGSFFDEHVLYEFVHPDDRERVKTELQGTFFGRKSATYDIEHRIIRKDGAVRWVHASGRRHWDSSARKYRVTGAVVDITDKKELQAHEELFVSALSHDLRNPLAASRARAELLKKRVSAIPNLSESLDKIILNIMRADEMIQQFLDVGRMRAEQRTPVELIECDLGAALQHTVADFAVRYGDRFVLNISGNLVGTWACRDILRIAENLIENAVKHGSPDNEVTISLMRLDKPSAAKLAVRNLGSPIPLSMQQKVFEPFQRMERVHRNATKGWGLGLALVKLLTEKLGGKLSLESSETSGTVFSVELPTATSV